MVLCLGPFLLCRVDMHERRSEAELCMRRKWMHVLFGGGAICCAGVTAYYALTLQRAIDTNRAIDATRSATVAQLTNGRASGTSSGVASGPASGLSSGSSSGSSSEPADEAPQVRLARAVALSAAGREAEAGKLLNELVLEPGPIDVKRAALFDLANLSLREAAGDDARGPLRSLPLLETAKARYRDLLRDDPADWDARYNLERALRLAPESPDEADTDQDIEQRRSVRVRGAQPQELP
jgi:mxaK protein